MNGALSKEIENGSKMRKNSGLSWWVIFFWSKTKCVGARISGGDPRGVHEAGAHPGGERALHPHGHVAAPPDVFSVPIILKYSGKKIIFHFQGIWRTFIFGVFLF